MKTNRKDELWHRDGALLPSDGKPRTGLRYDPDHNNDYGGLYCGAETIDDYEKDEDDDFEGDLVALLASRGIN